MPTKRTSDASGPGPRPPRMRPYGQTALEADAPFTDDPALLALERAAADAAPDQLPLFLPGPAGDFTPLLGGLPTLRAGSSLALARGWFRRELEGTGRPPNTVESYSYDLARLESEIGAKPIDEILGSDIARFLGGATNKATRKRRLTSVRGFFAYLIDHAKVLERDPTEGFYPHLIALRAPLPLFAEEQAAILAAAEADEAWSLPAIWLMLRVGLSRGELLALRREHVDLSDPAQPVVHVLYEDLAKRGKERRLGAGPEFGAMYEAFVDRREPVDLLFPCGFQAVNGMVDRVRKAAGLGREVTPQTLRHTFAVERAKSGADEAQLIALLGLADDPRNRASVRRYLRLAEPAL